jgi:hypothetical protein
LEKISKSALLLVALELAVVKLFLETLLTFMLSSTFQDVSRNNNGSIVFLFNSLKQSHSSVTL